MKREDVPKFVSILLDGRPVKWGESVFGFAGRERTLQIFNVDIDERRDLLRSLDRDKDRLEKAAGGPLVFVFHSVKQTKERYVEFSESLGKQ